MMRWPALDERRKSRGLLWHMQLLDSQEQKKVLYTLRKKIKVIKEMDEVEVVEY